MKKVRKGVAKMSQTVHNPDEIRKIIPVKTSGRFVAWDQRITTDPDFYKKMVNNFFYYSFRRIGNIH